VANWYTSTCGDCAVGCGLLVKTREARPIKLEGNEAHPLNRGGLCARGQASLLNLYDPDRLKNPVVIFSDGVSKPIKWVELDEQLKSKLSKIKESKGKVYFLTGALNSPSTQQVIQDFLSQFSGGTRVSYEGVVPEEIALAQKLSYGTAVTPRYRMDLAKLIVSFGADFLGTWLSPVEFAKDFSKGRKLDKNLMSRFVCFESALSLTGSNADEYHPLKPGDELLIALSLVNEIVVAKKRSRYAGDSQVAQAVSFYSVDSVAEQTGIKAEALRNLAEELWKNKGQGLVVGGAVKAKQNLALQLVVNLLNSALENDGVTVDASVSPSNQAESSYADLLKMVEEMKQGKVAALFIYKNNPVYDLPANLNFAEALKQVPLLVSFADRVDETASVCHYVAPDSHYLESWNDASPQKGLYSITQPAIAPLAETRSFQDSLIQWAGLTDKSWYDTLRNQWQQKIYPLASGMKSFEAFWEEVLQKGFFDSVGTRRNSTTGSRSFATRSLQTIQNPQPASADTFLALYPSLALFDGRSANNGWLQELPDPLSKVTWENTLSIAPKLAKKLQLQEGDVVRVEGAAVKIELPVHLQPKLHEKTVMVAVGYGRSRAGRVGNQLGVNTYPLQKSEGDSLEWSGRPVSLSKTGRHVVLASTQGFYNIEDKQAEKRGIIQEMTLAEYLANPAGHSSHGHAEEALPSMWPTYEYKGYRWGMSIDMNSCIGCNACMIGCQSENNIPVVGKEQVKNGRAMHWIRIDRYYKGESDNPEVNYQPMLCQHCENAPCETVCPVLATAHNDEGLNVQIYNRCVGTRYCSNNCPYKVRRFNFFDYSKQFVEPLNLVLNPDLTTRSRGVMEKCSFCIQRIQESKDAAKAKGSQVQEGALKTACQQSCPTNAITFGNTNDEKSAVAQLRKSSRAYHVLEEINVKPQVTYLQKVRNKT